MRAKSCLNNIISVFFTYIVILFAWRGAEVLMYGKAAPKIIDDIVAFILAYSLYKNFKKSKGEK